jgi:GNAT superfamily N-acetyltransferase
LICRPTGRRSLLPSIRIRSAVPADAGAIATLLGQLGYPTGPEEAAARLARLEAFSQAVVMVAESQDEVVGLITGHVFPSIHDTPLVAWLTTLVVDERHAHRGVGRELNAALESWAEERGAVRLSVTSGKHRDGAHAFYERLGYERTGIRLTKSLV